MDTIGFLDIAQVETEDGLVHLNVGKLRRHLLPHYARYLRALGYNFISTTDISQFLSGAKPKAIFLMYNETLAEQYNQWTLVEQLESRLLEAGIPTFHRARIGKLMGSKERTAAFFDEIDVPTPKRRTSTANGQVFSNALVGTAAPVFLMNEGDTLDTSRHNVDFIDTRVEYNNKLYYTSLRALCVGSKCLSVYVRARPESESSPSVHSRNTPKNIKLLRYLHTQLVEKNRPMIDSIAKAIGENFGPGFYAHDILPCTQTGKLYVCETGLKFNDWTYRRHLGLRGFFTHTPEMFTRRILKISAKTLVDELNTANGKW